jgi:rhodanese-related sulfurtransferase
MGAEIRATDYEPEKGKTVKVESWGRRRLAYPIGKQRRGVYVYVKYVGGERMGSKALAKETAMSVANASQHLKILENARLIEFRKEGRFSVYRLADPLVADFYRSYRLLGEDRLAEIQRLRQRFFGDGQDVYSVDREGLLRRVQAGEAVVIDVRPSNEYDTAHIARAISIPLKQLEERLAELPRDKNIVAYCRGPYCVLASEAVKLLAARGFHTFRLEDSVVDWQARGLPVETGELTSASPRGELA